MTNSPAPGAHVATDELPDLPDPFGAIPVYADDAEGNQTHEVDGWTADQMRGYAIDYAMQLGRAAIAGAPAEPPKPAEYVPIYKNISDHNGKLTGVQWVNAADAPKVGTPVEPPKPCGKCFWGDCPPCAAAGAGDTERLDWIDQQIAEKGSVWILPCGADMRFVQVRNSGHAHNYPTVEGKAREAIDAAMQALAPTQPTGEPE